MTEYHNFNVIDIKNTCRACLKITDDLIPMTASEINVFRRFITETPYVEDAVHICLVCRWILRKTMKFINQSQKANNILNENLHVQPKLCIYPELPSYDLKISGIETSYVGPTSDSDVKDDMDDYTMDDHGDDDDEIPLVMLKDELRRSRSFEIEPELKIKQEGVKEEYIESRVKKKRKDVKEVKRVKEGFSSRMVQETDEYVVIKLTKEQVLAELSEKAKVDSYIRSPYKCETCVKGFNFEDVLQTHMEKHSREHGSYLCDICTQYCPNPVSLRGHLKSHTTRYKCKLCGQVRLSRQHLLEHHAITHTHAATTYTCDKCHFTTNKRTVIQRHVKTHSASERHACHRCGKRFNTIESLRVHTMRHDKSKSVQCEHCHKQFIYPSLLHKHTQAVHERQDYYCVECDVSFKSPESLRLHFKKAKRHRDPSSYKHECPHCPKRFIASATLSAHLTTSHGKPKQHTCILCRRQYSSREALRAHVWRVHSHRDEVVSCHVCDKSFTRKSSLKVHLRSHSAIVGRPFTNDGVENQKQQDLVLPASSMPQEG